MIFVAFHELSAVVSLQISTGNINASAAKLWQYHVFHWYNQSIVRPSAFFLPGGAHIVTNGLRTRGGKHNGCISLFFYLAIGEEE